MAWSNSQTEYVQWSNSTLPEDYRHIVTSLLLRFNEWIQLDQTRGLTLDVGCGNDKIGGMSYGAFFGFDNSTNENWIGIDPLLGRCTVRAVAEFLPFKDQAFEKAIVYTSLDHFRDLKQSIREMLRVARELDVWFTDTRTETGDAAHAYRVKLELFLRLPRRVEMLIEPWPNSTFASTVFVKMIAEKIGGDGMCA